MQTGTQEDLEQHRRSTERWFVRRGLPHLIDNYSVSEDVLTRMAPFLGLVVFFEIFLVFGDRWTGWAQAGIFAACVAILAAIFASVNRLRGRRPFQLPERIGVLEVALYLALPAVPTALGTQGAVVVDVIGIVVINAVILVVGAVLTIWGVFPMLRWSAQQLRVQIGNIANLTIKSLPILLIFSAFIFLNAEMWQVANDFTLPYFGAVSILIVGIGSVFVMLSVGRFTVDLARFDNWGKVASRCVGTPVEELVPSVDAPPPDSPALHRRVRYNVSLLLFASQAMQIALVALVVTLFYLLFGLLTVREDTLLLWTTATELSRGADWALHFGFLGAELVFTRQLVLVASFIGLMSGLQFAVQIITDQSYREEHAQEMTDEIRQALAVRAVYHRVLVEESD